MRVLVDTWASMIHAYLVFRELSCAPRVSSCLLAIVQGIADSSGTSNFLRAFFMVSLNSMSYGSM